MERKNCVYSFIKKMYFSIYFSPKKAFETLIHNFSILLNFMLRKMFIKQSLPLQGYSLPISLRNIAGWGGWEVSFVWGDDKISLFTEERNE